MLAFRLTPNYSKKNEFVLSEELNADGFNPFSKTPRAISPVSLGSVHVLQTMEYLMNCRWWKV